MNEPAIRILVVDDDPGGRYVKAHLLRKHGYTVVEAATGEAGLQQCKDVEPDLVLLDVRLPDIDGVDVCREIKSAFPAITVLQTSAAVTSARDRATSLDGGADAFLVEPIEPEELLATTRALLRMRGAETALRRLNETLESLVADRTRDAMEAHHRLEIESAERRKAEQVLWHTQKLEVVGQLTGGIAHDFNNLLAVIMASLEMIRGSINDPQERARAKIQRLLQSAEAATDRGTKLTRQLLAFARRDTLRSEIVTVDEVIVACEPFLRRALGEAVTLQMTFAPGLWPCQLDPAQFESAMLNLIVNARDAMPDGGQLSISTSNMTLDAATAGQLGELTAGDYVCVQVTDSGTGMDADTAARAFEPFFTTKEVGKGTGLGLSQVYGFVKQSDGDVTIETRPGNGTTFKLYLHRSHDPKLVPVVAGDAARTPPTGSETVLVVEDDAEVRALATATIADLGYRVLTAPNGPAALDILHHEGRVDLLFSDVVLPGGMNGFELVNKARAIRNGLKALMTSGYAKVHRPGTGRPDVPLLAKPYRRAELAERIRLTLDR